MSNIDEALDYFFRYLEDRLTDEEKAEQEAIKLKNKDRKISDNTYCAFGCYEGEEEMSLDTH